MKQYGRVGESDVCAPRGDKRMVISGVFLALRTVSPTYKHTAQESFSLALSRCTGGLDDVPRRNSSHHAALLLLIHHLELKSCRKSKR
jgi:hypothetical protein